jgi:hypothetical protein
MKRAVFGIRYALCIALYASLVSTVSPLNATEPAYQLSVVTINGERRTRTERGAVPATPLIIETYSRTQASSSTPSNGTEIRVAFDALVQRALVTAQREDASRSQLHVTGTGVSRNAAIVHALMRAAQQQESSVSASSSSTVVGSHSRVVHEIRVGAHALVHDFTVTAIRIEEDAVKVTLTATLSRIGR